MRGVRKRESLGEVGESRALLVEQLLPHRVGIAHTEGPLVGLGEKGRGCAPENGLGMAVNGGRVGRPLPHAHFQVLELPLGSPMESSLFRSQYEFSECHFFAERTQVEGAHEARQVGVRLLLLGLEGLPVLGALPLRHHVPKVARRIQDLTFKLN